jgi:hypothetical protein
MISNTIPRRRSSAGVTQEDPASSVADEDVALLIYVLLQDEDLKEVFGEFLVPRSRVEA